jgi:adenylylsulfate kinase
VSWAVWITGEPGSGKSAVARALASHLAARGHPAVVLELSEIQTILTPAPTHTDAEHDLVHRALVYMARVLTNAGIGVIIDATAPRRTWRDLARAAIGKFAEVQVCCPVEVCRARGTRPATVSAPSRIHVAAGRPGSTGPSVDVPYEPTLSPEVVVDTAREDVARVVARIVPVVLKLAGTDIPAGRCYSEAAWAIWITGPPGSGKTTLASGAAEGVSALGLPVAILEPLPHELLVGDRPGLPWEEDIVHRALALTAKLLTDAGIPVIIDATAPRREWRRLARELIGHFAEIQLLCPPDVCMQRERRTRWGLVLSAQHRHASGPVRTAPDIVLVYEPAPDAELTLHTDSQAVWTAVAEVVALARSLHRAASRPKL